MFENCPNCKHILEIKCFLCKKYVCLKCDVHTNYNKYVLFCENCKECICPTCNCIRENCIKCNALVCVDCDGGEMDTNGELYFCRKHKKLTIDELYNYVVKKYDEKLTLDEIRELVRVRS